MLTGRNGRRKPGHTPSDERHRELPRRFQRCSDACRIGKGTQEPGELDQFLESYPPEPFAAEEARMAAYLKQHLPKR